MREETFTSEVTLNVLHVWKKKKSKRASGKVLFDALIAMNKRDVALRFGEELLGQGEAKLFVFVCVCTHVCVSVISKFLSHQVTYQLVTN